jgi:hypothetical protein
MSRITQNPAVAPLEIFQQANSNPSTTSGTGYSDGSFNTYLGQRFVTSDGREFTMVQNGATALVPGNLVQGIAVTANHQNLAVSVATVLGTAGTNQVSVTLGATVLNAQQYMGGYLVVDSGTGLGQTLKIASNPAAAASAAGVVITLEDPIQVTLDATSTVCLIPNPYQAVAISATLTGTPVGITVGPMAASTLPTYSGTTGAQLTTGTLQYGLVCSKGPVACLSDANAATVGLGLMPSTTTAGSVTVQTATGANVGRALQATVPAKARIIYVDV